MTAAVGAVLGTAAAARIPVGMIAGGLIARVDLRLPFVVGGAGIVLAALVSHRQLLLLSRSHSAEVIPA